MSKLAFQISSTLLSLLCGGALDSVDECNAADANESCKAANMPQKIAELPPISSDDQSASYLVLLAVLIGIAITSVPYLIRILDGKPFARLSICGILPEDWVSGSVLSVSALLELKRSPRPEIMLANGAADDNNIGILGEALREYGKRAQVRTVALINNLNLSVDGVDVLCRAALISSSTIEELDLTSNLHFGNAIVNVMAPFVAAGNKERKQLRELRLVNCGMTAEGVRSLGSALATSVLRTLDLSVNSLAGAGQALGELVDAPLLEELILSRCGLGDEDFAFMTEELADSHLRSLELSGNAITEVGVAALVGPLAEASLVNLSLASNSIFAGNALGRLASAWTSKLERRGILRLRGNKLSSSESKAFEELVTSLGLTNFKWDN